MGIKGKSLLACAVAAILFCLGAYPAAAQVSLNNLGITFPDSTIQTTAAGPNTAVAIDQAIVTAGLAPCDDGTPGFPCTLSGPGHYYLTSDLTVPDENTDGIVLGGAGTFRIDLNGHEIKGPNECASPSTCSLPGTGIGIHGQDDIAEISDVRFLIIKNGTVRGMGSHGIVGRFGVKLFDVNLVSNGGNGLWAEGGFSKVTIEASFAGYNGLHGFTGDVGVVRSSTTRTNGGDGFNFAAATIDDCIADDNLGNGYTVQQSSVVRGCHANSSGGDGYNVGFTCSVIECVSASNEGYGIASTASTNLPGYMGCIISNGSNNTNENEPGVGLINLGQNICGSDTVCP